MMQDSSLCKDTAVDLKYVDEVRVFRVTCSKRPHHRDGGAVTYTKKCGERQPFLVTLSSIKTCFPSGFQALLT